MSNVIQFRPRAREQRTEALAAIFFGPGVCYVVPSHAIAATMFLAEPHDEWPTCRIEFRNAVTVPPMFDGLTPTTVQVAILSGVGFYVCSVNVGENDADPWRAGSTFRLPTMRFQMKDARQ